MADYYIKARKEKINIDQINLEKANNYCQARNQQGQYAVFKKLYERDK